MDSWVPSPAAVSGYSILSKFDGQGWVLWPDGTADELQECWRVGGTHPWACTVPRWWHWRWRCVNPRRSGRWPPQPMGASLVVSEVATAHWQNTPAGQTHCSGQKTWNHSANIMSASHSDKKKLYLYISTPVLPACYKIGVFHKVSINILHVVAVRQTTNKETLVKILSLTHP